MQNDNMLSSQTEKQGTAGASAEEADLLRRSKKKTKRGAHERDDELVQMEEDGQTESGPESRNNTEEQISSPFQPTRRPAISFRRALTGLNDSVNMHNLKIEHRLRMAELRQTPMTSQRKRELDQHGKLERKGRKNQEASRPLGDKYGSWMIAQRKNKNYQNTGYQRHNTGRQTGEKPTLQKERRMVAKETTLIILTKKGSKFGITRGLVLWIVLEEDHDEEAQEDIFLEENPEGPSGTLLSGKGKRAPESLQSKTRGTECRKEQKECEPSGREEGHTVAGENEHHQDPPNTDKTLNMGDEGDPMADVEFTTGQTSEDPEVVEQ
nr:uncharacterized protein LOC109158743 [Ipomoea batatas]